MYYSHAVVDGVICFYHFTIKLNFLQVSVKTVKKQFLHDVNNR